jgi:hypothetical protein
MPRNSEERVETLHPDPERKGTRISRAMYDAVREAILDVVPDGEPGLRFADLSAAVENRVSRGLFENASVGWYTTTVKLDLEARGLLSRVSGSRQQRLVRTPGRATR